MPEIRYTIQTSGQSELDKLSQSQTQLKQNVDTVSASLRAQDDAARKTASSLDSAARSAQSLSSTPSLDPRTLNDYSRAAEKAASGISALGDLVEETGTRSARSTKSASDALDEFFAKSQKISSAIPRLQQPESGRDLKNDSIEAARAKLIETAHRQLDASIQKQQLSELSGLDRIEAKRQILLSDLGHDAQLREKINQLADREAAAEAKKQGRQRELEEARNIAAARERVVQVEQSLLSPLQRVETERKKLLDLAKNDLDLQTRINAAFDAKAKKEGNSSLGAQVRNAIQNPLQSIGGFAGEAVDALGPVGIAAGAVAVAFGIAAKASLDFVAAQGEVAHQLQNTATRLGLSTSEVERLSAASKIAGINFDSVEGAARTLGAALEDPAGAGKKASTELQKLGIALTDSKGAAREIGPVLLDVLQKLSTIGSTSERINAARLLLPRGAANQLIPLIANYEKLNQIVAGLKTIGVNPDLNRDLVEAEEQINAAAVAWEQLKKSLAAPIAKIVIPIVRTFTDEATGAGPFASGNADNLFFNFGKNLLLQKAESQIAEKKRKIDPLLKESAELNQKLQTLDQALPLAAPKDRPQLAQERDVVAETIKRKKAEFARAQQQLDELQNTAKQAAVKSSNDPALSKANSIISGFGEQEAAKARAEAERTKEGLEARKRELESEIAKRETALESKSFTDPAGRKQATADQSRDRAELAKTEAAIKAISKAESDRNAIKRELEQLTAQANEFELNGIAKILAKRDDLIAKLREQGATQADLARVSQFAQREIRTEQLKQETEELRAQIPLLEKRAALDLQPNQELEGIRRAHALRVQNAQQVTQLQLAAISSAKQAQLEDIARRQQAHQISASGAAQERQSAEELASIRRQQVEQDSTRANRAAAIQQEASLLDLLRKQVEARRQTSEEFALTEAKARAQSKEREIERPEPGGPKPDDEQEQQARSLFEVRKSLIEQEAEIRVSKGEKAADVDKQKALELFNIEQELDNRLFDIRRQRQREIINLELEQARAKSNQSVRLVEIASQPGDEAANIERIHALRVKAAEEEFQIAGDRDALAKNLDDAEFERVQKILELRRQELDHFKEEAGQLYDSFKDGGAGVQKFFQAQANNLGRKAFENLAGIGFDRTRDSLPTIPGQTRTKKDAEGNAVLGPDGKPQQEQTVFGKLLAGLPGGAKLNQDQQKVALEASTNSTKLLADVNQRLHDRIAELIQTLPAASKGNAYTIPGKGKVEAAEKADERQTAEALGPKAVTELERANGSLTQILGALNASAKASANLQVSAPGPGTVAIPVVDESKSAASDDSSSVSPALKSQPFHDLGASPKALPNAAPKLDLAQNQSALEAETAATRQLAAVNLQLIDRIVSLTQAFPPQKPASGSPAKAETAAPRADQSNLKATVRNGGGIVDEYGQPRDGRTPNDTGDNAAANPPVPADTTARPASTPEPTGLQDAIAKTSGIATAITQSFGSGGSAISGITGTIAGIASKLGAKTYTPATGAATSGKSAQSGATPLPTGNNNAPVVSAVQSAERNIDAQLEQINATLNQILADTKTSASSGGASSESSPLAGLGGLLKGNGAGNQGSGETPSEGVFTGIGGNGDFGGETDNASDGGGNGYEGPSISANDSVSGGSSGAVSNFALGGLIAGIGGLVAGLKEAKHSPVAGGLQTASGALGVAAAVDPEPISKAALAIGSVVTKLAGGIAGLIEGDPRKNREREQTRELENAQFNRPDAVNVSVDSSGKAVDHDFKDNLRVLDAAPRIQYYNQATGFDPLHPNNVVTKLNGFVGTAPIGAPATPPPPTGGFNFTALVDALNPRNTQQPTAPKAVPSAPPSNPPSSDGSAKSFAALVQHLESLGNAFTDGGATSKNQPIPPGPAPVQQPAPKIASAPAAIPATAPADRASQRLSSLIEGLQGLGRSFAERSKKDAAPPIAPAFPATPSQPKTTGTPAPVIIPSPLTAAALAPLVQRLDAFSASFSDGRKPTQPQSAPVIQAQPAAIAATTATPSPTPAPKPSVDRGSDVSSLQQHLDSLANAFKQQRRPTPETPTSADRQKAPGLVAQTAPAISPTLPPPGRSTNLDGLTQRIESLTNAFSDNRKAVPAQQPVPAQPVTPRGINAPPATASAAPTTRLFDPTALIRHLDSLTNAFSDQRKPTQQQPTTPSVTPRTVTAPSAKPPIAPAVRPFDSGAITERLDSLANAFSAVAAARKETPVAAHPASQPSPQPPVAKTPEVAPPAAAQRTSPLPDAFGRQIEALANALSDSRKAAVASAPIINLPAAPKPQAAAEPPVITARPSVDHTPALSDVRQRLESLTNAFADQRRPSVTDQEPQRTGGTSPIKPVVQVVPAPTAPRQSDPNAARLAERIDSLTNAFNRGTTKPSPNLPPATPPAALPSAQKTEATASPTPAIGPRLFDPSELIHRLGALTNAFTDQRKPGPQQPVPAQPSVTPPGERTPAPPAPVAPTARTSDPSALIQRLDSIANAFSGQRKTNQQQPERTTPQPVTPRIEPTPAVPVSIAPAARPLDSSALIQRLDSLANTFTDRSARNPAPTAEPTTAAARPFPASAETERAPIIVATPINASVFSPLVVALNRNTFSNSRRAEQPYTPTPNVSAFPKPAAAVQPPTPPVPKNIDRGPDLSDIRQHLAALANKSSDRQKPSTVPLESQFIASPKPAVQVIPAPPQVAQRQSDSNSALLAERIESLTNAFTSGHGKPSTDTAPPTTPVSPPSVPKGIEQPTINPRSDTRTSDISAFGQRIETLTNAFTDQRKPVAQQQEPTAQPPAAPRIERAPAPPAPAGLGARPFDSTALIRHLDTLSNAFSDQRKPVAQHQPAPPSQQATPRAAAAPPPAIVAPNISRTPDSGALLQRLDNPANAFGEKRRTVPDQQSAQPSPQAQLRIISTPVSPAPVAPVVRPFDSAVVPAPVPPAARPFDSSALIQHLDSLANAFTDQRKQSPAQLPAQPTPAPRAEKTPAPLTPLAPTARPFDSGALTQALGSLANAFTDRRKPTPQPTPQAVAPQIVTTPAPPQAVTPTARPFDPSKLFQRLDALANTFSDGARRQAQAQATAVVPPPTAIPPRTEAPAIAKQLDALTSTLSNRLKPAPVPTVPTSVAGAFSFKALTDALNSRTAPQPTAPTASTASAPPANPPADTSARSFALLSQHFESLTNAFTDRATSKPEARKEVVAPAQPVTPRPVSAPAAPAPAGIVARPFDSGARTAERLDSLANAFSAASARKEAPPAAIPAPRPSPLSVAPVIVQPAAAPRTPDTSAALTKQLELFASVLGNQLKPPTTPAPAIQPRTAPQASAPISLPVQPSRAARGSDAYALGQHLDALTNAFADNRKAAARNSRDTTNTALPQPALLRPTRTDDKEAGRFFDAGSSAFAKELNRGFALFSNALLDSKTAQPSQSHDAATRLVNPPAPLVDSPSTQLPPRDLTPQIQQTQTHTSNTTHNYYVSMPITAMDTKSILDRRDDIATAMKQILQSSHPFNAELDRAVHPR